MTQNTDRTFRTREDQVVELTRELKASLTALDSKLRVELAEAEARGAAEAVLKMAFSTEQKAIEERKAGKRGEAFWRVCLINALTDPEGRSNEEAQSHIDLLISEFKEIGAEERAKSIGYLFDNPDTGTEHLPYHPIESGECQYAENIREATSAELLSELQNAWKSWKEDRDEKEKGATHVAALERDLNSWRDRFWAADKERSEYRKCMTDCLNLPNHSKTGGLLRIWLQNSLDKHPQYPEED